MKKLLIGCLGLFVAMIAAIVIATVIWGPRLFNLVSDLATDEAVRMEISSSWQPSDASDDWSVRLPEMVGLYERITLPEQIMLPSIDIPIQGWAADYQGVDGIVSAFWLSKNDYSFNQVVNTVSDHSEGNGFKSRVSMNLGHRAYQYWSNPENEFHLWNLPDAILVTHANRTHDDALIFIEQLLDATGTYNHSIANDSVSEPTAEVSEDVFPN